MNEIGAMFPLFFFLVNLLYANAPRPSDPSKKRCRRWGWKRGGSGGGGGSAVVVVAAQQQHCRGKQRIDGVCSAVLAAAAQGSVGRVSEAVRQRHGDGSHRGGSGGSAREAAAAGGGGGSLAAA